MRVALGSASMQARKRNRSGAAIHRILNPLIVGGGGHAHVMASLIGRAVTFVTPEPEGSEQLAMSLFLQDIDKHRRRPIYIGVGDNLARARIFAQLKELDVTVATLVAREAFVAASADVGEGAFVGAFTVIGARARLACNVIVNNQAGVEHDCNVGAHAQIAPGARLAGNVKFGSLSFAGLGCGVIQGLTVGERSVIAAGAMVTKPVPDKVMVAGVPAIIKKRLGD